MSAHRNQPSITHGPNFYKYPDIFLSHGHDGWYVGSPLTPRSDQSFASQKVLLGHILNHGNQVFCLKNANNHDFKKPCN